MYFMLLVIDTENYPKIRLANTYLDYSWSLNYSAHYVDIK